MVVAAVIISVINDFVVFTEALNELNSLGYRDGSSLHRNGRNILRLNSKKK